MTRQEGSVTPAELDALRQRLAALAAK